MYQPQLAALEANTVREQEGVLYQDILNPRDTHKFVIYSVLEGDKNERSKNFLSCEHTDAVSPSRHGCWKMTYRLERSRNKEQESAYSASFQKELIDPEICLADILILPYPGTQFKMPCHLTQNFIFPL